MNETKSILERRLSETPPADQRWYRTMDDIAARIQDLMERQGLTQDALATRMGKHKSYISRVLSGGVNLTLKTIAEFEEALDASILQVMPVEQAELPRRRKKNQVAAASSSESTAEEALHLVKLPGTLGESLRERAHEEGTEPEVLAAYYISTCLTRARPIESA